MGIEVGTPRRRVLSVVAIIIAGVLLCAVLSVKGARAEPLRVAVTPSVHSALIYLADAQGFFKKQGVDIVMKVYQSGHLAIDDCVADKVDVAAATEIAFVFQSFKHPELRMLATICVASDHELVVRKDRGITRPQDLQGRQVAATRGSSAEFFFYNYLIFNRIPAESVRVVDTLPSEMVKAMAEGRVDAAISWAPFTLQIAKQLGEKAARWPAQSGQDAYFTLAAKEGFLKKQSKTMERFVAALSMAEDFVAKYPDRAQTILNRTLKLRHSSRTGPSTASSSN